MPDVEKADIEGKTKKGAGIGRAGAGSCGRGMRAWKA